MIQIWETRAFLKQKCQVVLLIKTRDNQMHQPPTEPTRTGPATSAETHPKGKLTRRWRAAGRHPSARISFCSAAWALAENLWKIMLRCCQQRTLCCKLHIQLRSVVKAKHHSNRIRESVGRYGAKFKHRHPRCGPYFRNCDHSECRSLSQLYGLAQGDG